MTKSDEYFLHQQMKRCIFSLSEETEEPLIIFNLLIEIGLISPDDTYMLMDAFFGMKRHAILAIIREIEQPRPPIRSSSVPHSHSIAKRYSTQLTEKFIYEFCREELGPNDLMPLGLKGLKLPRDVTQRTISNNRITLNASLALFARWREYTSCNEDDVTPPFTMSGLTEALKDAQLTRAMINLMKY